MSQQSDLADDVYGRLSTAPVSAASLFRKLRRRWSVKHGFAEVHCFVREVIGCLLLHEDVEVGEMTAGRFVSWKLDSCDADDKVDAELMAMDVFLDDEGKYVFQKRPAA